MSSPPPLLGGEKVMQDAVDLAVSREAQRLAKLAGFTADQSPTDEHLTEAVKLVKRRILHLLEWVP